MKSVFLQEVQQQDREVMVMWNQRIFCLVRLDLQMIRNFTLLILV